MPPMPGMTMVAYPSALAEALFYRSALVAAVATALALIAARGWLRLAARPDAGAPASPSARYRNTLAVGIGVLWLVDGVLQAQPLMATRFLGGLVAPLAVGQPAPVAAIVQVGVRLWGLSPLWFNVLAALTQLLIGLGLVFSRDGSRLRRTALWLSIAWGLAVWSAGEAFGSLAHDGGPLVGSPGSVLLYIVAAALLLLPRERWDGVRLWRAVPIGFAAYFGLMTLLQALPADGWWRPSGLAAFVAAMARMPQPALAARPLALWALSLHAHPTAWNAAIVASTLALGAAWLARPHSPATLWATLAWTLLLWSFGQDFGVLGGMGTDPNTGAVLLVYALVWGERLGVFGRAGARQPALRSRAPARER